LAEESAKVSGRSAQEYTVRQHEDIPMTSADPGYTRWQVGDLCVDAGTRRLTRAGHEIVLPRLSWDMLLALLRAAPNAVTVEQLMDEVWPGLVVNPETVSKRVNLLRHALDDDCQDPRYIEGVRGYGYRVVAQIKPLAGDDIAATTGAAGYRRTWPLASGIGLAVLVLVLGYFAITEIPTNIQVPHQQPADVESAKAEKSIAVLPFVNMSSDEDQEYFSDGLSEELLNLLATIPGLDVAARTSSFSFRNKDLELPEIASRLKVTHVLEGSVRKHGDQVRITAQLIQADNGYHLWSATYDKQLDDVFQIQEDIAVSIVEALRIPLLGEAPEIRKTDPAAYQLFLEGQYRKRQLTRDSLLHAIELFKQAAEIDPAYVPAWAELADTYFWTGGTDSLSREEVWNLADQAIQTAISTEPEYAFAYYVRGIWWIWARNSFKEGLEDFRHALALEPGNAFLVAAIGKGAFLTGQFELAITQYQAALALEPIVPEFYWYLGMAYLSSGRLDQAEASFRTLSNLSPSDRADYYLWKTLFSKGELEAALAELGTPYTRAVTHHALGDSAEADEAFAEVIRNYGAYEIAQVYGYRGDVDKTFEWLDRHLENNGRFPPFVLGETAFRSIHSDRRWRPFLEKLGLLDYWLEMSPDRDKNAMSRR
jgi:TolB-like protein/DNA-binding winged helix-turn-helix (wHTH) protein